MKIKDSPQVTSCWLFFKTRVEFVSDGMSYIVLRGRWCNVIVLNAHAPNKEKSEASKDSC